jgi:hypothetical protein
MKLNNENPCSLAIIIPVYKEKLSREEQISLKRITDIGLPYPVFFITCADLNLQCYNISNLNVSIKFFDCHYFHSIQGYNDLMLSKQFYKEFIDFDFILIYQLDAYIFSLDLQSWMNKGIDYVGAPWFENFSDHESGKRLWKVGNGGFSLRKTNAMYKLLVHRGPVFKARELRAKGLFNPNRYWIIEDLFLWIKAVTGIKNNITYFLRQNKLNEDYFLTQFFLGSQLELKLPSPEDSAKFAFEKSPTYLFNLIGKKLPIGCHAWNKYEYDSFWKDYIK